MMSIAIAIIAMGIGVSIVLFVMIASGINRGAAEKNKRREVDPMDWLNDLMDDKPKRDRRYRVGADGELVETDDFAASKKSNQE